MTYEANAPSARIYLCALGATRFTIRGLRKRDSVPLNGVLIGQAERGNRIPLGPTTEFPGSANPLPSQCSRPMSLQACSAFYGALWKVLFQQFGATSRNGDISIQ